MLNTQRQFSTQAVAPTEPATKEDDQVNILSKDMVFETKSPEEKGIEMTERHRQRNDLVPGKTYRNVDTSVKHLQHMTSEDLAAPDSQMVASQMKDLIAEARDKIKPVIKTMPDEELKELIMTLEEAKQDNQIMINRPKFYEVIERIGVTMEELRKI